MLHEGNSGSFSSNDGIALDPYAKLELIKSRPLPGMRLEKLILEIITAKNAYDEQSLSIVVVIFGCNGKSFTRIVDTDQSTVLPWSLLRLHCSLYVIASTASEDEGTTVIEVIAQCMGLLALRRVVGRENHFRLALHELQMRDLQAKFCLSAPADLQPAILKS